MTTPYSQKVYPNVNGTTSTFSIPFTYIDPSYISVFVNGVAATFTFPTTNQVTITPTPAAGTTVTIVRNTDKTQRLVVWEDGSTIVAPDLNESAQQVFDIVQENYDSVGNFLGLDNTLAKWDAESRVLSNVAPGVNPNDAVNVSQTSTIVASATASATSAANSASAAVAAATSASVSAASALLSASKFASVLDYGATGNSITDDTTAIQNALNAHSRVAFPIGIYKISGNLVVNSGQFIIGDGYNTVIKSAANNLRMLRFINKANTYVGHLVLDGGGQTTDIYSGMRQCQGVYIDGLQHGLFDNVICQNMGVVNQSSITSDATYGGMGFTVDNESGLSYDITFRKCQAINIAGGGNATGDGFGIFAFAADGTVNTHEIRLDDCYVSKVGRHCYSHASNDGVSIPVNTVLRNCYGEKAALCGIDSEHGQYTLLDNCHFYKCGNDQSYYNPSVVWSSSYALMAAMRFAFYCANVTINKCSTDTCFRGLATNNATPVRVYDTIFQNSVDQDLNTESPSDIVNMVGCQLLSTNTSITTGFNSNSGSRKTFKDCVMSAPVTITSANYEVFEDCRFANQVILNASTFLTFRACLFNFPIQFGNSNTDFVFDDCEFNGGVYWSTTGGAATANYRFTFDKCYGYDFGAPSITVPSNSYVHDVTVNKCNFVGSSHLTYGITVGSNAAINWSVDGNFFNTLQNHGVYISDPTGNSMKIKGNWFNGMVNGVTCATGALTDFDIEGNHYLGITGTCISITNTGAMVNCNIKDNIASKTTTCANGLIVTNSGGSWDYSIITGNNFHYCTGTKWTLPASAGHDVTTNNITT